MSSKATELVNNPVIDILPSPFEAKDSQNEGQENSQK